MSAADILHATTLARRTHGAWRGLLVCGASGRGKSDLALRALHAGWRLVADDRTQVWVSAGGLYGRAPDVLAGLLEVRGVGIASCARLPLVRLAGVVHAAGGEMERLPDPAAETLLGVDLPRHQLDLVEPSAPAKLALILQAAAAGRGVGRL